MFASLGHTASRTVLGAFGALVFAGACLGAATAPAKAETMAQGPSIEVRTTDLDLASSAGRIELTRRINAAARKVCAVRSPGAYAQTLEQQCVSQTVAATHIRVAALVKAERGS